jgi:TonB family protein
MKFYLMCAGILMLAPVLVSEDQSKNICVVYWKSPNYNEVARGARLQGDVRLRVSIDKDGRVSKATVVESNANKLLQDEAMKNVTEWMFNTGDERVFETRYEFRLLMPEIPSFVPTFVTMDFPGRVHIESNFKTIMRD